MKSFIGENHAKLSITNLPQSLGIGQKSDGDISNFRIFQILYK